MSDLISRQAAIDALCKSECGWNNAECRHKDGTDFCVTCDNVKIIKSLPPAQPEQPEQRWIPFKTRPLTKAEIERIAREIKDAPVMVSPSAQPEQRYTEEELRVFQHGISLSLLSKRSSQHWQYDEDTATEIKFLERLYEKVVADMRGEQDGRFNQQTGGD